MGLCYDCVFLPDKRKDFYCEHALKRELNLENLGGRSGGMLLGDYSNLRKKSLGLLDDDEIDVVDMLSSISTKKKVSQEELEQRRRQKTRFKNAGFVRADSNDERANQELQWARY